MKLLILIPAQSMLNQCRLQNSHAFAFREIYAQILVKRKILRQTKHP